MFRSVLRANTPMTLRRVAPATVRVNAARFMMPTRHYSAANKLTNEAVQTRVLDVIKAFNKTNSVADVSAKTTYHQDLGLDSLDTVELLVAIEEEFEIEIPDKVADELKTVGETVEYIAANPESL